MPRYALQQPNGKLGFFSTIVDDFTWTNADEDELLAELAYEMGVPSAADKILRARADERSEYSDGPRPDGLGRWLGAMEWVLVIHGEERFQEVLKETTAGGDYPKADLEGLAERARASRRERDAEDDEAFRPLTEADVKAVLEEPQLSWEDITGS